MTTILALIGLVALAAGTALAIDGWLTRLAQPAFRREEKGEPQTGSPSNKKKRAQPGA